MPGWIKIHREITEHWIWCDAERLKWWLDLLFMASFEDKLILQDSHYFMLKRGQIVASAQYLAETWNKSRPTVIKFLELLEKEGMISRQVIFRHTPIITICNYDKFQVQDSENSVDTLTTCKLDGNISNVTATKSSNLTCKEKIEFDTLIDTSVDTILDTLAKKEKYAKEKNIKRNSSSTLNAHAREKELYDKLKKSEIWIEQVAMKFHLPIERIVSEIDDFALDCDCRGKEHNRLNDTKQHFCDWLRLKIERENNVTDKSKSESKRRGTEVTATSWQDYEGAF